MEADYHSKIKTSIHRETQQNATFWCRVGQIRADAGGLFAFAMPMKGVTIPVVRKNLVPFAEIFREKLVGSRFS